MYIKFRYSVYKFYLNYLKNLNIFDNSKMISCSVFKKISNNEFNPRKPKLKKNSIIYINPKFLKDFIINVKDYKSALAVICCNCKNYKFEEIDFLELPKNISLFLSNVDIEYENFNNIFPIPIGLHNSKNLFLRKGIKKSVIEKFSKNPKILCNFNPTTNETRKNLIRSIFENDLIKYQNYLKHNEYLNELSRNMFVLCPSGSLIDTHRFWETIYSGSVPIVKKNNIYLYFRNLGVPMLIVNEWNDLNKLNEKNLFDLFLSFQEINFREYLDIDFWNNFIFNNIDFIEN